ncbi:AAA family ATPase [Arcobacter sp. FWKO B]|uniref:AAA family ATPase n=1 Tax=Arcobacter sp. FWKO B TaxID=2593672 RepID=UPI0018A3CD93|nr:AAA family ATPase [Arcobacter sp. FWKO B]QOG12350.1 AAA family ATPase [Arcobacter sp. FWKO B]
MKTIILIVGASGVGKDTLINAIKDDIKANFVTRYVTRIPDENETNYYIAKEDFVCLKDKDFFVSFWEAHGNCYGVSKNSILDGLNIISVSRDSIKDFEENFSDVVTIDIKIPTNMLYERLKNRNREDEEEILKRIKRSDKKVQANRLITFYNDKSIDQSKEELISLIRSIEQ